MLTGQITTEENLNNSPKNTLKITENENKPSFLITSTNMFLILILILIWLYTILYYIFYYPLFYWQHYKYTDVVFCLVICIYRSCHKNLLRKHTHTKLNYIYNDLNTSLLWETFSEVKFILMFLNKVKIQQSWYHNWYRKLYNLKKKCLSRTHTHTREHTHAHAHTLHKKLAMKVIFMFVSMCTM